MLYKAGLWLCAIVMVMLVSTGARANGPNVGFDAGGIVPLDNLDIQLVSESVRVPLAGGKVSCLYTLRNLKGSAVSLAIGFVTNVPWPTRPDAYSAHYNGAEMRVWRDGSRLPLRLEALAKEHWTPFFRNPPDSLPVFEVSFAPFEKVSLNIDYQATPSGGCDGSQCGSEMTYFAATARLWAGTVDHANISFEFGQIASLLARCDPDFEECLGLHATPPGYTVHASKVMWDLSNWEPQEDFKVSMSWNERE